MENISEKILCSKWLIFKNSMRLFFVPFVFTAISFHTSFVVNLCPVFIIIVSKRFIIILYFWRKKCLHTYNFHIEDLFFLFSNDGCSLVALQKERWTSSLIWQLHNTMITEMGKEICTTAFFILLMSDWYALYEWKIQINCSILWYINLHFCSQLFNNKTFWKSCINCL